MLRSAILILAVAVFSGCGPGGPELARVTGSVTVDGKPVPNAVLTFFPEFSNGSTSYGVTDKDGKYELMFSDQDKGAMIGAFRVSIVTKRVSKDELPDGGAPVLETVFVEIPKKYRGDNANKAEVKRGSNTIDFPMTSK